MKMSQKRQGIKCSDNDNDNDKIKRRIHMHASCSHTPPINAKQGVESDRVDALRSCETKSMR